MSRYIDTEKADDVIQSELGVYDTTELKEMLKYFPTEDVAPIVHAHWKVAFGNPIFDYRYICECSNCENDFWMRKDKEKEWSYCPACGAKMDEEEI